VCNDGHLLVALHLLPDASTAYLCLQLLAVVGRCVLRAGSDFDVHPNLPATTSESTRGGRRSRTSRCIGTCCLPTERHRSAATCDGGADSDSLSNAVLWRNQQPTYAPAADAAHSDREHGDRISAADAEKGRFR
jgi:hypothetical protein